MISIRKYFTKTDFTKWDIVDFHRSWIEKHNDRPEKLAYKIAADKLTRSLRDIVNSSSDVDAVRKALSLQEKANTKASIFSCANAML